MKKIINEEFEKDVQKLAHKYGYFVKNIACKIPKEKSSEGFIHIDIYTDYRYQINDELK